MDRPVTPTGHLWTRNVFAVREWAIARMKADARAGVKTDEEIFDIEDWCRVWIENDPRDNGGDASVRREMRSEWREIWRDYQRLSA
jgi:hypothetical protein